MIAGLVVAVFITLGVVVVCGLVDATLDGVLVAGVRAVWRPMVDRWFRPPERVTVAARPATPLDEAIADDLVPLADVIELAEARAEKEAATGWRTPVSANRPPGDKSPHNAKPSVVTWPDGDFLQRLEQIREASRQTGIRLGLTGDGRVVSPPHLPTGWVHTQTVVRGPVGQTVRSSLDPELTTTVVRTWDGRVVREERDGEAR